MAYFMLCMVLLWMVNVGTCGSNMFVWTGIMPMQVSLILPQSGISVAG